MSSPAVWMTTSTDTGLKLMRWRWSAWSPARRHAEVNRRPERYHLPPPGVDDAGEHFIECFEGWVVVGVQFVGALQQHPQPQESATRPARRGRRDSRRGRRSWRHTSQAAELTADAFKYVGDLALFAESA